MQSLDPTAIDVLPEEPPSKRPPILILWLVSLSLVVVLLGLLLIARTIEAGQAPLVAELADLAATLTSTAPPNPQEADLRATLLELREQNVALSRLSTELDETNINWPDVLSVLSTFDPAVMQLVELAQTNNQIILRGSADNELSVIHYTERLKLSPYFNRVIIQSIIVRAMPAGTPAAGTTTLTGAPQQPLTPEASTFTEFTVFLEIEVGQDD